MHAHISLQAGPQRRHIEEEEATIAVCLQSAPPTHVHGSPRPSLYVPATFLLRPCMPHAHMYVQKQRNGRLSERELMRDRTQHKVEILVALETRAGRRVLYYKQDEDDALWLAAFCILYVKALYSAAATCPVSEVAGRPGVASFQHLLISCWHDMVGSPHQTAPVLQLNWLQVACCVPGGASPFSPTIEHFCILARYGARIYRIC